jgi:hypothetical protein
MSSFANFFGKGLKKFASFFWRSGASTIEMGQDLNVTNNGFNNIQNSEGDAIIKNFNTNNNNNINSTSISSPKFAIWDENKKPQVEISGENLANRSSYEIFKKMMNKLRSQSNSDKNKSTLEEKFLKSNILSNRVCKLTYAANDPIEDKLNAIQLKNFDGYFISVLDGHGGFEVADFASRELHRKFDQQFLNLMTSNTGKYMSEQDKVVSSINYAFDEIVN